MIVSLLPGAAGKIEGPHITQYWHSEDVPDYIAGLLETFHDLNPTMRHTVFSESSAAAFIEEHLEPRHLHAFQACAVPAMQADYFRYCAVFALGGVYCDADARCIADLGSLVPTAGEGRLFHRGDGPGVINALFAFGAPGHPFLELVLEIVTTNIERRICDRVYFTTGPPIFTSLFWLHRLNSVDAFLEHADKGNYFRYGRAYVDAIDDYSQVERAFEGIVVSPAAENVWTGVPTVHLAYKETDDHFPRAAGKIFR